MNGVPIDLWTVLYAVWFVGNALIGAVGFIYFYSVTEKNKRIRHLVLAGLAGYIYFNLYSTHNFPNTIMALIVGWFAPDFVEGIMRKYKEKKGGNNSGT